LARLGSFFILGLLLCLPTSAVAAADKTSSYDLWYGVFFGQLKIGHAHFSSQPGTFEGHAATQMDSTIDTKLTVLGASVEQHVVSRTYADASTLAPLYEDFKTSSGGETTEVTARFHPTYIEAELISAGSSTKKRVPIPAGTKLSSDDSSNGFDTSQKLHVGQSETETVFNPLTLSLEKIGARVQQGNVVVYDPLSTDTKSTWKVLITSPEGDQTLYQDPDGNPVRIEMTAGLVMLREGQQVALADNDPNASRAGAAASAPVPAAPQGAGYTPPADFAVATSVDPGGKAISDPRHCRYLSIRVTEPDKTPQLFEIKAASTPNDPTLTVQDAAKIPDLASSLSDAPYLSLNDPIIQQHAQEIRGTRTNLYDIAVQIHSWVHAHMTPNGTLGLPRAARAICADPRGVCRDYAILYTALARAAGVPTRLCAGIVAFQGRFYYHAWAESYVGGSVGWLPIDPTLPQMFVDATHVPLAKGDPTVMYTLSGVIGGIKAQVLAAAS
ncbi:MAG TPA: transglutaminase-like domain-containing protein, partial [Capsulimonadaceae bacterium]|nr:transglutaminase-like domain-containing protein [Capsulimonadaceae bacterium]